MFNIALSIKSVLNKVNKLPGEGKATLYQLLEKMEISESQDAAIWTLFWGSNKIQKQRQNINQTLFIIPRIETDFFTQAKHQQKPAHIAATSLTNIRPTKGTKMILITTTKRP